MKDISTFYAPATDFIVTDIPKSEDLIKAENAGLLLTDEATKSLQGIESVPTHTVHLVGPEVKNVNIGDKVYVRGSGIAIPIDGEEYVQFRSYDVIGTVLK